MSDQDLDLRVGEPPPFPAEARHYPTHPLFPLPEGVRETKEIHEITFDRWNDKGVKERCPDRFRASELTSLAQVVDMFGGGTYQFIAFDSRGNFSRWTPEKEKVRVDLPCKPFRQVERADAAQETQQARTPAQHAAPTDYMALLMQQSIAAQERADRLMAALIDRLASPPATQDRTDRLVAALVERLATPPAPPPPPPPPPPAPDPLAMLTGVATVLEKLRPAQSGDMISQLSGLVSVLKQLKGTNPTESSSSEDDIALQPFMTMVTNAMMQQNGSRRADTPATSSAPTTPPDLVWVHLPDHGPVLMRLDQAARAASRPPAQPPPALPASSPSSTAATPEASTPASASPAPAASTPAAAPPAPEASTPAAAPPAPAPSPAPQAPPAASPAAPPSSAVASPAPSQPTAATPPAERCIICAEPGRRDPAADNVLLCRNGHRSLLSSPNGTGAKLPITPALLEGLPSSISISQLDAMLSDPEVLQALTPDVAAALRKVRTQIRQP